MAPIEEETSIHLSEYYRLILRKKWVIILSLVVVMGLAMRYNSQLVPVYGATAVLIIDNNMPRSSLTGNIRDYYLSYLSESMTFKTHFQLITSRPVLDQVIQNLKLDSEQPEKELVEIDPAKQFWSRVKQNFLLLTGQQHSPPSPADPRDSLALALKSMVTIENIEETRLLKINVSSPSPTRARDVANALSEAYISFNLSNLMKSTQDTLKWLTDRTYDAKKSLEDAEEEFLAYKQNIKVISVEGRQKIIGQKITDFNDAYLAARNQRLGLDAELEQLNKITLSNGNMSLPRSLIENNLINELHGQLVTAELELSRLSKVYKSKHPKMIQIQGDINQTRKKLNQEIRKELDNLKAKREVLLSREKVLQQSIADFEQEGMETNKKELGYTILQRNVEMNQKLYDTLLSRIKEADIAGDVDVSNIRIVEKAQLPTSPIGPNKQRNILFAAVLGLILGFGISFLWEYIDRSLRTEDDVQKYLGLPVLSIIPSAEDGLHEVHRHKPKTRDEGIRN